MLTVAICNTQLANSLYYFSFITEQYISESVADCSYLKESLQIFKDECREW